MWKADREPIKAATRSGDAFIGIRICKSLSAVPTFLKTHWVGTRTPQEWTPFRCFNISTIPNFIAISAISILHILPHSLTSLRLMFLCSMFLQPWGQSWCGHWVLHLVALLSCCIFQAGLWPHATHKQQILGACISSPCSLRQSVQICIKHATVSPTSAFVLEIWSFPSWERGPLCKPDATAALTCIHNIWTSQLNAQNNVHSP